MGHLEVGGVGHHRSPAAGAQGHTIGVVVLRGAALGGAAFALLRVCD